MEREYAEEDLLASLEDQHSREVPRLQTTLVHTHIRWLLLPLQNRPETLMQHPNALHRKRRYPRLITTVRMRNGLWNLPPRSRKRLQQCLL